MLLLSALLLGTAAGTAPVSAGPDLGERAVAVDLPITEVAVFSDRARVTRSSSLRFQAGSQVFRAPDLPGVVQLDTIRVTADGAKVVRVETSPVERERWSIDQVDTWIAELEALNDQVALVAGRLAVARQELQLLSSIQVAAPLPEKDRVGKLISPSATAWMEAQDRLARRRSAAREVERTVELELRALMERYQAAQREVQRRDIGGFSDQKIEVLIIVDGAAGNGTLAVEYGVPGAFWKPAYDLAFDPDGATVALKASGLVTQATGEDWTNVKLALSTAIPGQGIDLPSLRTWTLGDDREFVPMPTARNTPRTTRPFSPPTPRPRLAEIEREADRDLLEVRSEQLMAMASSPMESLDDVLIGLGAGEGGTLGLLSGEASYGSGGLGMHGTGNGGGGSGLGRAGNRRSMPPPPPSPAPARARVSRSSAKSMAPPMEPMSAPVMDMEMADEDDSYTRTAASDGPRVRSRGLALNNATAWRRPTFSDPMLPAMSAGGLDYVYDAPVRVTVPSQASGLRVPLAARTYNVQTFYEATPSLATTAYLKASVKNGSKLPILAGPANVFVKGTFSGDANLMTTGPGGALELPLGADEDIRLTRTVVPATRTQGMFFGEEDVTDYTVTIEVGNYKKRPITVRVVDQLPKTNVEKMKVEMVSVSPKPQAKPDGDGLLYWHVDVAAGAVAKVTFQYRITRPKDWRLHQ